MRNLKQNTKDSKLDALTTFTVFFAGLAAIFGTTVLCYISQKAIEEKHEPEMDHIEAKQEQIIATY